MRLDNEQQRVLRGGLLALLTVGLTLLIGYYSIPEGVFAYEDTVTQVLSLMRYEIFVLVWLLVGVGRVANGRFFSPSDIAGSGLTHASPGLAVRLAFLQNTLEQVMLAIGVHMILATLLVGREVILIPVMILLFSIGRICFLYGYSGGAGSRAYGFGLTFYPTALGFVLAIFLVLTR